jgi:hypothetical protein
MAEAADAFGISQGRFQRYPAGGEAAAMLPLQGHGPMRCVAFDYVFEGLYPGHDLLSPLPAGGRHSCAGKAAPFMPRLLHWSRKTRAFRNSSVKPSAPARSVCSDGQERLARIRYSLRCDRSVARQ